MDEPDRRQAAANNLIAVLTRRPVATIDELKAVLQTDVRMTVYRVLKDIAYQTSYSHGGRYYALKELMEFDQHGLWSARSVWFSKHGTLMATLEQCIRDAERGYFSSELEALLHVGAKESLLRLTQQGTPLHHEPCRNNSWRLLSTAGHNAPSQTEQRDSLCRHRPRHPASWRRHPIQAEPVCPVSHPDHQSATEANTAAPCGVVIDATAPRGQSSNARAMISDMIGGSPGGKVNVESRRRGRAPVLGSSPDRTNREMTSPTVTPSSSVMQLAASRTSSSRLRMVRTPRA